MESRFRFGRFPALPATAVAAEFEPDFDGETEPDEVEVTVKELFELLFVVLLLCFRAERGEAEGVVLAGEVVEFRCIFCF